MQSAEHKQKLLTTLTNLKAAVTSNIAAVMNGILADVIALYLKTKNFRWHMSGPHFRNYHLLLDEHGDQLFAVTDRSSSACASSVPLRSSRSAT